MNRNEIIKASAEIANKEGLKNLTSSRLAEEFHVKPPSLYKHIRNIQEIHDELGIICISEIIKFIHTNSFGLSGDEAIREFCRSSRTYALKNPGLYEAMQLTHVKRSKLYQEGAETLLQMLFKLVSQYNIEKENYVHIIRNLRCILHGFIDLEIKDGFGLSADLDKSFEMAVDGYISLLNNYRKTHKI